MKKTILKMVFGEIFLINSQSGQQKNRTIKFEENSKKIIEIWQIPKKLFSFFPGFEIFTKCWP